MGYEIRPSSSENMSLAECYHSIFCYPKLNNGFDKHIKNLSLLMSAELDQRVKYFYDSVSRFFYKKIKFFKGNKKNELQYYIYI